MKRLIALAALALGAAVAGFFLGNPNWSAETSSARLDTAAPARAPASASAKPNSVPLPATPKKNRLATLRETKACLDSEACDYPQTDPRSYSFAVGRALAKQLKELGEAFADDPTLEDEVGQAAREFMAFEDGFVQEEAMRLFSRLPPSAANVDAMLSGLQNSPDPLLVEQAMQEWERYLGTSEEARIQEFLAGFIAHGGQFSSEKASALILSFLNERSLPLFEEKLALMVPESTPARYLKAALHQYKMQRQGG